MFQIQFFIFIVECHQCVFLDGFGPFILFLACDVPCPLAFSDVGFLNGSHTSAVEGENFHKQFIIPKKGLQLIFWLGTGVYM